MSKKCCTTVIDRAFILAAGRGERLRPYTDRLPKPMMEIGGDTLINAAVCKLEKAGVKEIIVNLHYKGDIIEEHLRKNNRCSNIYFSHEEKLLDTGGGIKKALVESGWLDDAKNCGDDAFYIISGDAYWEDGRGRSVFEQLLEMWEPEKMDILMLLQPVEDMKLTAAVGDYNLGEDGRAVRSVDKSGEYMFTSIRISKISIFKDAGDSIFSYLELMDRAEKAGRLYGLPIEGSWHHISTPEDLENVNRYTGTKKGQSSRIGAKTGS